MAAPLQIRREEHVGAAFLLLLETKVGELGADHRLESGILAVLVKRDEFFKVHEPLFKVAVERLKP